MLIANPQEWARVRAEGRSSFVKQFGLRRFALRTGFLVWSTLYVVVPLLMVDDAPRWGYLGSRAFVLSTLASLCLWPIAGYLFGQIEWRRLERRFGQ